jgi:hypothetical protein
LGDESLRHQLSQRAAAVGGGNPEATLNSLHRLVESDLVARMDAMTEFSATDAPRAPLLNSALDARRNRLLLEIQDHIERLRVRNIRTRWLPPSTSGGTLLRCTAHIPTFVLRALSAIALSYSAWWVFLLTLLPSGFTGCARKTRSPMRFFAFSRRRRA